MRKSALRCMNMPGDPVGGKQVESRSLCYADLTEDETERAGLPAASAYPCPSGYPRSEVRRTTDCTDGHGWKLRNKASERVIQMCTTCTYRVVNGLWAECETRRRKDAKRDAG
jgi:hypothetical protein